MTRRIFAALMLTLSLAPICFAGGPGGGGGGGGQPTLNPFVGT